MIVDGTKTEIKPITPESPRSRDQALIDGAACRAAALEYLALGLAPSTCCPPDHLQVGNTHQKKCRNPGKVPWGKWKELQTRKSTIEELEKKWRDNPYMNVGTFLGPVCNLVRLDIDGQAGEEMLHDLCGELPPTWEFTSGGHGRGLLYRIPEGTVIRTTTHKAEGIHAEVRFQAKGAQTVLPPSRHPSGMYYRWKSGHAPNEIDAAILPPALVAMMQVKPKSQMAASADRGPSFSAGNLERRVAAYLRKPDPAISGQGGSKRLMSVTRNVTDGYALDRETAFTFIKRYYNPTCLPEWSDAELLHKIDDVLADPSPNRGRLLREHGNGKIHSNGDGKHDESPNDPFDGGISDDILDQAPAPDGPPESDNFDQAPNDEKGVTNFRTVTVAAGERTKKVKIGLSPDAINAQLKQHVHNWPKAVSGLPFVEGEDRKPRYLEKATQTFAWLATQLGKGEIDNRLKWSEHGDTLLSRAQFHEYLRHEVEQFDGVEHVPHFPPIPLLFYMHEPVGIGNGTCLNTFLGFFSPATAIDRQLTLGFVASLVWGGDRGKRPAWIITGPDQDDHGGRGVGKTALVEKCASIVGGVIAIADPSQARADEIERRLLSPGGRGFRVLMIDNLKALKFSWSYLESIITSDTISGRMMYVGEGRRANTLMTVITANGATLGRDMAQRCNVLKLARPTYAAGDWDDAITDFLNRNRQAILADLNAFFQRPRGVIETPTRWGPWQNDVLSRLENPTQIQAELERRSKDCDADDEEVQLVRNEIMGAIEMRGFTPSSVKAKIHAKTLANLVNQAMNERMPTPKANAFARMLQIRELCGFTRRGGRQYIWVGADADPDSTAALEL